MIEFTCPGCLSSHVANEAFAGLRARCVVCGAHLRIPGESGRVAEPLAAPAPVRMPGARPAAPKPARRGAGSAPSAPRARPTAKLEPEDDDLEVDDLLLTDEESELEEHAHTEVRARESEAKAARRARAAALSAEADALDDAFEDADEPEEDEPKQDKPRTLRKTSKEPETPAEAAARKKKLIRIGGGAAAVLGVALIGYFAFGREKPKPAPTPPPPQQAKVDPPPPPKKEEKKPEPPPPKAVEIAPSPRPGGIPIPFTTARLLAERAENVTAFEKAHHGKLLLVQGSLRRSERGTLLLAENPQTEFGVSCAMLHADFKARTNPDEPSSDPFLQPGQGIAIRGVYAGALRLTECTIARTQCAGDEDYKDKVIELTGTVSRVSADPDDNERFPNLTMEPTTTDSPVSVRFLFHLTEREQLGKLKPGQQVTVRGRCEGRSYRMVRFHDCQLIGPNDAVPPLVLRVPLEQFFTTYEADLLANERADPNETPIPITAEQLAATYGQNSEVANASYRYHAVQVTGRVLERRLGTRTIVLETGTTHRYQILAAFSPAQFRAVKDEVVTTVRGTCVGIRGPYVRLENAERVDPTIAEPGVLRVTADFLPLRSGRELTYHQLSPTAPPFTPKGKENPNLAQLSVRFAEPDLVRVTTLRTGVFSGATLFGESPVQPKWMKEAPKPPIPPQLFQHRIQDNVIELRPIPDAPKQPGPWWDPVLKLGVKKGDSWSTEMPNGHTLTYSVVAFGKDDAGRQTVELLRVEKDSKSPDNPKQPTFWEEWKIVHAQGVGEVKRVVTTRASTGQAIATLELKLIEVVKDPKEMDDKKDAKDKDGK